MALVINDRVKENSTTSGTGNITLAGVASGQGNVTFNSGIGVGNTSSFSRVCTCNGCCVIKE
jgi:hypothetical protein